MTMEPTAAAARPHPLEIEWRESRPLTVVLRQKPARICLCGAAARFFQRKLGTMRVQRGRSQARPRRSAKGFTLLELLVVLAIIGLMAGLTLPHLRGFGKANAMRAATRQLMDDVAYARQRALANRSTVYMVFVPPAPWNHISQANLDSLSGNVLSNLVASQYRGYALVSLRSVGDQPGQWHPSFLTDWKTLPTGVFIQTNQFVNYNQPAGLFSIFTTNTLSNTRNQYAVYSLANCYNQALPFPTLQAYTNHLPYIGFSPNGSLVDENGNPVPDQYIALTSGGIIYPSDDNGYLFEAPLVAESPVGESTNNANLIHIDAATARAHLERNQF